MGAHKNHSYYFQMGFKMFRTWHIKYYFMKARKNVVSDFSYFVVIYLQAEQNRPPIADPWQSDIPWPISLRKVTQLSLN